MVNCLGPRIKRRTMWQGASPTVFHYVRDRIGTVITRDKIEKITCRVFLLGRNGDAELIHDRLASIEHSFFDTLQNPNHVWSDGTVGGWNFALTVRGKEVFTKPNRTYRLEIVLHPKVGAIYPMVFDLVTVPLHSMDHENASVNLD